MTVEFTVERLPAAPENYRLVYYKPNQLRIEYPGGMMMTDGKTLWEYTKSSNEYLEAPGDLNAMASKIKSSEYMAWAAFFFGDQLKNVKDANAGRKLSMGGTQVTTVNFTLDSVKNQTASFYIDEKLGAARGASVKGPNGEVLVKAKSLEISDKAADTSIFTFAPPAGSKKVEIVAGDLTKWYENLEEGLKVAKATRRLAFVDFTATWCGPCQMYIKEVFPTPEFQAKAKDFVFISIDIDQQPAVAQRFGISAIPDLRFLDADGNQIHKTIGYKGMALLADFDTAKSNAGR
jgi:thiol-disulfide isomerase/thioredoxin